MAKVIQITEQAWRNEILPRLRYVDRLRQNAVGARSRDVTAYRIPSQPARVAQVTLIFPNRWKYNLRGTSWNSVNKTLIQPPESLRFIGYNTYEQNNTATKVGHGINLTGTMGILPIPVGEIVWMQRVGNDALGEPEFAFYAINQFTGCPA